MTSENLEWYKQEGSELPQSDSVRLIDFESVAIVPGTVNDTWILIVSGTKPCVNMTVTLSPRVYVQRPEFWEIEVTATVPGPCLTQTAPYVATLPLDGVIGTKGIEVVGANKKERRTGPPF